MPVLVIVLINKDLQKTNMHESSQINYSRRNWPSIGDLNKSAQSYCVRIMIYQITFKKWNKSNLTGIHPIQDSRHTHHNLQLGMQKNVNLNSWKEIRLLLRKLLRSTDDKNQHCGLPCDQVYIFAPKKFEVNQLIINICTQLEDI